MLTGPKGQKRPADAIGRAVHIAQIATGEVEDVVVDDGKDPNARAPKPGRPKSYKKKTFQTETLPVDGIAI